MNGQTPRILPDRHGLHQTPYVTAFSTAWEGRDAPDLKGVNRDRTQRLAIPSFGGAVGRYDMLSHVPFADQL
jgi:hypothetical protein